LASDHAQTAKESERWRSLDASSWLRGSVGTPSRSAAAVCLVAAAIAATGQSISRMYFNNGCQNLLRHPTTNSGEVAKKVKRCRAKKGQPVGELYPHFARADCYAQPIVQSASSSSSSRPWLLIPIDQRAQPAVNLIAAETLHPVLHPPRRLPTRWSAARPSGASTDFPRCCCCCVHLFFLLLLPPPHRTPLPP
jgi:hypothetical protein